MTPLRTNNIDTDDASSKNGIDTDDVYSNK